MYWPPYRDSTDDVLLESLDTFIPPGREFLKLFGALILKSELVFWNFN